MKGFFYAIAILTLLSVPSFASEKAKHQHIVLANPVTVGSTEFAPGDCIVTWVEAGDSVQVTLTHQRKDTSVTVPAKLVKGDHPYSSLTTTLVGGVSTLSELQFDHFSLVFEGAEVASNTAPKAEP